MGDSELTAYPLCWPALLEESVRVNGAIEGACHGSFGLHR